MKENHFEYDKYLEYWEQTRVFVEGLKDVQGYLQNVVPSSDPNAVLRNKFYKERAKYTNFSQRTRNALVGAVFRKDPAKELPTGLEFLETNANGAGLHLLQLAKHLVTNLIEVGRHGLFVDYGNSAKIVTYKAEKVPYWETDEMGVLVKVKLVKDEDHYKMLVLKDGLYSIEMYKEDELIETIEVKGADGKQLTYIPFIFCGSTDNSPDVDDVVLWPIVDMSHGHYQNSADYEDLLRYLMPTPYVTVPNKQWMDEMLPNGVYSFGDGSIIPVPDGGQAGLLQASENQMHQKAMQHKEELLIKLGARIISDSTGVETAEAARIKFSSENSILDNLAQNASMALEQCLLWCGIFEGVKGDVTYELNRDFFDTTMTAQEITAMIMLEDRGTIAKTDSREMLRRVGYITRTDDEIDEDAEVNTGL
jgi:hypothetical protein